MLFCCVKSSVVVFLSLSVFAFAFALALPAQTVTVRNVGPIVAHNVVVGVRVALGVGVSEFYDAALVPDAFERGLFRWTVGTLAVGESRAASLYFRASHATPDGPAVQTEAFVGSVAEKTIFIHDDVDKATLIAQRRIDLRVSHRSVGGFFCLFWSTSA